MATCVHCHTELVMARQLLEWVDIDDFLEYEDEIWMEDNESDVEISGLYCPKCNVFNERTGWDLVEQGDSWTVEKLRESQVPMSLAEAILNYGKLCKKMGVAQVAKTLNPENTELDDKIAFATGLLGVQVNNLDKILDLDLDELRSLIQGIKDYEG